MSGQEIINLWYAFCIGQPRLFYQTNLPEKKHTPYFMTYKILFTKHFLKIPLWPINWSSVSPKYYFLPIVNEKQECSTMNILYRQIFFKLFNVEYYYANSSFVSEATICSWSFQLLSKDLNLRKLLFIQTSTSNFFP